MLLSNARHAPVLGLPCLLFSLPELLLTRTSAWLSPQTQSYSAVLFSMRLFLATLFKNEKPWKLPHSKSYRLYFPWACMLWNLLICFVYCCPSIRNISPLKGRDFSLLCLLMVSFHNTAPHIVGASEILAECMGRKQGLCKFLVVVVGGGENQTNKPLEFLVFFKCLCIAFTFCTQQLIPSSE